MFKYVSIGLATLCAAFIVLIIVLSNQKGLLQEQNATYKASLEWIDQQHTLSMEKQQAITSVLKEQLKIKKSNEEAAQLVSNKIRVLLNEMANSCVLNDDLYGVFMESYQGAGGSGMRTTE